MKKLKGDYVTCLLKSVDRAATVPINYKAVLEEIRMPEGVNEQVVNVEIREDRDKL